MLSVLRKCCGCVGWMQRKAVLPTDTPSVVAKKRLLVSFHFTMFVLSVIAETFLVYVLLKGETVYLRRLHSLIGLVASAVSLVWMLRQNPVSDTFVAIGLYAYGISFLLIDVTAAIISSGVRGWPLFVVLLDVGLVCKLRNNAGRNLVVIVVAWLLADSAEAAYRYGLYDLPSLEPYDYRTSYHNCAEPPCTISLFKTSINFLCSVAVLLFDYHFTRGFAHGLAKEHERMESVIIAAEEIATALSRFDLLSADRAIHDAATLPPQLAVAFSKVLANLHVYKPYLPQSCTSPLDFKEKEEEAVEPNEVTSGPSIGSSVSSPTARSQSSHSTEAVPNMVSGLEQRRASFHVVNLSGTHDLLDRAGPEEYQVVFAQYLSGVLSMYSTCGAMVSYIAGDRVHASFNALRVCSQHVKKAVDAALALQGTMSKASLMATVGVSVGQGHYGPLGTADLKAMSTLSPSVHQAVVCERLAKEVPHRVVCTGAVYKELFYTHTMRIMLVKVTSGTRQLCCYEVLCAASTAENTEWMYSIQECIWAAYNDAAKLHLEGKQQEAERQLAANRSAHGVDGLELALETVRVLTV